MRVLIVEREPLIALSLAAELRLAGHEVLGPSDDADEALCLAESQGADIALIEVGPNGVVDGVDLARILQAQRQIPVLFLTTQPAVAQQNADAAMGMITLPFDPADISDSIHAAAIVMRGGRPALPKVPQSLHLF